jgi:RNA polymerase sigma-70 factor (ECF subfamily)
MLGTGSVCRDSRLLPTIANGSPAFGQYHLLAPGEAEQHAAVHAMVTGAETAALPEGAGDGAYLPWSLIVLELSAGRIVGVNHFLDTDRLFPLFDLPPFLEA